MSFALLNFLFRTFTWSWAVNCFKGQMNQKIDIFSFIALPSPNTKKNHPKWDLGKYFSSQAFIERLKIKIRAFPKTSRKRFWNGRVIDWRLRDVRDVNVGLSGRKNVVRKLLRIPYRLRLFVSFCESSDWDWMKCTRCERLLAVKALFFVFVVFSSLENYFRFRTTNVRVKTDHSVSLRWNKTFWTFPKRFVFFW